MVTHCVWCWAWPPSQSSIHTVGLHRVDGGSHVGIWGGGTQIAEIEGEPIVFHSGSDITGDPVVDLLWFCQRQERDSEEERHIMMVGILDVLLGAEALNVGVLTLDEMLGDLQFHVHIHIGVFETRLADPIGIGNVLAGRFETWHTFGHS